MNGVVPSPAVAEKALRLLEQNRVDALWAGDPADGRPTARVGGDSGGHFVYAQSNGVFCDCLAGGNFDPVSCSHKVAAQIAWAEA